MKLMLLFWLIPILNFAQSNIEGIGKFKIKKTTIAYLDTICKEQDLDRVIFRNFQDQMKGGRRAKLAEIIADTLTMYSSPSHARFRKEVKVFYISKMRISTIDITNTYLTFYRDTLVDINTDFTLDISQALELKYGKGEVEQKDKIINCTITFTGQKVEHTETMFYTRWRNGDITCTAAVGDYFDNECKKQSLSYISIITFKAYKKVGDCDEEMKAKIKARKDTNKKKELKDF